MRPENIFSSARGKPAVHVERMAIDFDLANALKVDRHIIIFGPAGQGKTTHLLKHVKLEDCCVVDCRSGLKRSDIYRILLASAGYSVIKERRRKGRAGANATVKLFGSSIGGEAGGETESVISELTADISNGTEVAALLAESKPRKFLLLNNFDHLRASTQENIAAEMGIFDEWSLLRFIIIGRWSDRFYIEKLSADLAGKLEKIHVPFWSDKDLRDYLAFCNDELKDPLPAPAIQEICTVSGGDIGIANRLALVYFEQSASSEFDHSMFAGACKRFIANRYRDIYLSRLIQFAACESLAVLFEKLVPVTKTNKVLVPIRDPEEVKEIFGDEAVERILPTLKVDSRGEYYFEKEDEIEAEENIGYKVFVGFWLLKVFFESAQAVRGRSIPIKEVVTRFESDFLGEANSFKEARLERIFLSLMEAQREQGVEPAIFTLDKTESTISVSDRHIEIFFEIYDKEEIFDDIQDHIDNLRVDTQVRKRNRISSVQNCNRATFVVGAAPS